MDFTEHMVTCVEKFVFKSSFFFFFFFFKGKVNMEKNTLKSQLFFF